MAAAKSQNSLPQALAVIINICVPEKGDTIIQETLTAPMACFSVG